jgi:hypothetical protein
VEENYVSVKKTYNWSNGNVTDWGLLGNHPIVEANTFGCGNWNGKYRQNKRQSTYWFAWKSWTRLDVSQIGSFSLNVPAKMTLRQIIRDGIQEKRVTLVSRRAEFVSWKACWLVFGCRN